MTTPLNARSLELASPPAPRSCWCRLIFVGLIAASLHGQLARGSTYPERWVWMFGWNLAQDQEVAAMAQVLTNASRHGLNGAVFSLGLDTLCKKTPESFQRLERIQTICREQQLEFIPAIFSVGYGGGMLSHDRSLAEGLPVRAAPFVVSNREARLVHTAGPLLANGGFERFTGARFGSYALLDQPGTVSCVDTQITHSGKAALRLERFTTNPHGHGRVMQEIAVQPHRSYRIRVWVRTEELQPTSAFNLQVLAGNRSLAPRQFDLKPTSEWRQLTMIFNSLQFDRVRVYAGMWGGKTGKLWLDDWTVEEIGPLNVLRRPGTPVSVTSEDEKIVYAEGQDYAPLVDPNYSPYRIEREPPPLRILPGGRIQDGQRLRVSWYHPMLIHQSQVTVCMAEPALYSIIDEEAKLLAERIRPRRVLLNMDEVRMGGTCRACAGRDMAQLLGECVTRQAASLRRYQPGVEVAIWSDMLDPHHNAHGDYYLVQGDFTGTWKHVPKDLLIVVWGGAPREKSVAFFEKEGFRTLIGCYYDAADLKEVEQWLAVAKKYPGVRGFMYTPWERKYDLLPRFGDLLRQP